MRPLDRLSSIFADLDSDPTTILSPWPLQKRPKINRMASSFQLGDDQPSPQEEQRNTRRRRTWTKPSVNPVTGEPIGIFGTAEQGLSTTRDEDPAAARQLVSTAITPRSGRVPPGGFSTPLW